MDASVARAIAAWKEILLLLLLVGVVVHAAVRSTAGRSIASTDLLVGGLIATALCYLLAANPLFRAGLPSTSQLLGFRDAAYFMLIYFVGRSTPSLVGDEVVIRRVFFIGVITCAIGIIERFALTPDMLVALGVAAYFQDFLGVAEFTAGNEYGLPMNYWASMGSVSVRRAGSVFLSAQAFAVPFLVFFPVALVSVFDRGRRSVPYLIGFAVICAGLLLTITRMTIAAAFVQLILFVTLRRRPEWAVAGVVGAGMLFLTALLAIPEFGQFVWHTLVWEESSAQGHAAEWARGVAAFFERPWGWGLGTADQTAVRAGLTPITGDNLYLKYGVELGILGLGLLIATFAAIAVAAFRLFRRAGPPAWRKLGLIVFLATVGVAINALTSSVFNSVPLGWLFFWAAGAAVTLSQRASLPISISADSDSSPR